MGPICWMKVLVLVRLGYRAPMWGQPLHPVLASPGCCGAGTRIPLPWTTHPSPAGLAPPIRLGS